MRRHREAVAGGWDQGHAVGVGPDQRREQGAQVLRLREPVLQRERPGGGLTGQRSLARGADRMQLKSVAGDVEVHEPIRDVEQMTLAG